jgi:hypothetical protein
LIKRPFSGGATTSRPTPRAAALFQRPTTPQLSTPSWQRSAGYQPSRQTSGSLPGAADASCATPRSQSFSRYLMLRWQRRCSMDWCQRVANCRGHADQAAFPRAQKQDTDTG